MKNKLCAIALLAYAAHAQAASLDTVWSGLWHNADQRGQALLRQGKAAAAAKEFTDPHRKGYAEFKAGDYAAAARDLAGLDDSDAHYNRGNALAHAGDLQGALKAYDAALKRDPGNRDARHNREVVANALKQQQQKQQQEGGKQGEQKGEKENGKQTGQGQSQSGAQNDKPGDSGKPGKPAEDKPGSGADKQPKANKEQAGGNTASGGQQPDTQSRPNHEPGNASDDAEQARREIEAMKDGTKDGKQDQSGSRLMSDAPNGAPGISKPPSEKQMSQEQWLRSIPDDPGGLLRRKFLIEHMMRQQRAQQ